MGVTDINVRLRTMDIKKFKEIVKEYNDLCSKRDELRNKYDHSSCKLFNKVTNKSVYGLEIDKLFYSLLEKEAKEFFNNRSFTLDGLHPNDILDKLDLSYEELFENNDFEFMEFYDENNSDFDHIGEKLYDDVLKINRYNVYNDEIGPYINFISTVGNFNECIANFFRYKGIPDHDISFMVAHSIDSKDYIDTVILFDGRSYFV